MLALASCGPFAKPRGRKMFDYDDPDLLDLLYGESKSVQDLDLEDCIILMYG